MDGLPLHNSGPTQLWPILPVFVVALCCGTTCAEDYPRQVVEELNRLQSAGVTLSRKKVKIRVRAIIVPVRALIKDKLRWN